jgi:Rps23 Pro-64 3,4-dihydroxylase Tpa1-like proline 4-hydroxylase
MINYSLLEQNAALYNEQFNSAMPFKWIVIDDFVPLEASRTLNRGFDLVMKRANANPDAEKKHRHVLRKIGISRLELMEECHRSFFSELGSARFLDLIQRITGIAPLYGDAGLVGGGLHEIYPGGYLNIHTDFNFHPVTKKHRRLNILVYLNEAWQDGWQGHLELWPEDNSACAVKMTPLAGRMVLFETSEVSFHGHTHPLACPSGITRRSLAAYYYSDWPTGLKEREKTNYRLTPRQREQLSKAIAQLRAAGKSREDTIEELSKLHEKRDIKAVIADIWR